MTSKNTGMKSSFGMLSAMLQRMNILGANITDQVICVEEMTKTHEFVQSVKHISGKNHHVITFLQISKLLPSRDPAVEKMLAC